MRLLAALLFISAGAALAGCGETVTAKVEVPVRTAPASDREIIALIPRGSAVKVSSCAHGWCEVSWQGQQGYALAKSFSVPGLDRGTTETDADSDQFKQEGGADDE